jgi:DNA-binding XRE family transcriptional regulator
MTRLSRRAPPLRTIIPEISARSTRIGTIVPGKIVLPVFAILAMNLRKVMAVNVRRARLARELTQEELADRAGVSARYLGSIERSAVAASVTVLGRLAKALRVDPCELLRGAPRR